jgi:Pyruvate/2-oxoacid:ferredoxin oxidoreductase delta subunit
MENKVDKADINKINKDLFAAFKLDDKSDAIAGYLYLKYMYVLSRSIFQALGGEVGEPVQKVNQGTEEMVKLLVDQIIARGISKDTSIMHGKIVLPDDARKFVTQTQNMHLVPSERIIPFKVTREVIFENPDSIALGRCMCRAVVANPCVPPSEQNLCIWIGEPNASFISTHNEYFRKVTPRDAIQVLEDAHKAGFYHCAYFEKPAADRFNCICNCCHCCCFGLRNWPLIGSNDNPFLAPSGYAPVVKGDACSGCGDCEKRCGFQAIKVDEKTQKAVVNLERCMGCGFCEEACPERAIGLRLEPALGDPFDIEAMKQEADSGRKG